MSSPKSPETVAVMGHGAVLPQAQILAAGCGCGGPSSADFVYAIGTLDYDFPVIARADSIRQHMDQIQATGYKPDPRVHLDFLRHLYGFQEVEVSYESGRIIQVAPDINTGRVKVTLDREILTKEDNGRKIEIGGVQEVDNFPNTFTTFINNTHTIQIILDPGAFLLEDTFQPVPGVSYVPNTGEWLLPRKCTKLKHPAHRFDAKSVTWVLFQEQSPLYAILPSGPFSEDAYGELIDFLLHQSGLERDSLDFYFSRDPFGKANPWNLRWDPCFNDATCCFEKSWCCDNYQNPNAVPALLSTGADPTDRVAISGTVRGSVQLLTGETLPVVDPDMRGTSEWSRGSLIKQIEDAATSMTRGLTPDQIQILQPIIGDLVDSLYEAVRNAGRAPDERALNFASTQLLGYIVASYQDLLNNPLELDGIPAPQPSAVCRTGSLCFDVEVSFFDPVNIQKALTVVRQTIDVSDVVPVLLDGLKSFKRRG